ncbi:MAG TPA: hypothetical protein VMB48_11640 [Steroidobacteraceae bacterium]|nr:hypothetical protein [Steroidobacteraceae bacterium]
MRAGGARPAADPQPPPTGAGARAGIRWRHCALLLTALAGLAGAARADTWYVTVAGLGGEPDYEQRFTAEAADLDRIFRSLGDDAHVTTLSGAAATRAHLTQVLEDVARRAAPRDVFVLVLIGHGSFDGVEYRFNLPGPDISAGALAELCNAIPAARQLIVNTSSASGGSVAALGRSGRAVIAATKSGTEKNATVFARYFVEALQDPAADTDKNQAITALEALRYAQAKTAAFYESQKRLATEHAIFQEGARGPPVRADARDAGAAADLLAGLTLMRLGSPEVASDPARRALLRRKQELEQQIDLLKYQRAAMSSEDYRQQLTDALVKLAKVQGELDK